MSHWHHDALCLGWAFEHPEDPDRWFPCGPGSAVRTQIADAKEACAECPVKDECLESELKYALQWGVWGETSEDERVAIRRRRAAEARRARDGGAT